MSSNICSLFSQTIRSVVDEETFLRALHEPAFDQDDILCVTDTVKSGWVSYQGGMVSLFQRDLESYLGEEYHVVPVVNGTSALFLSLKCLEIGDQDEVLVPAITFIATSNAVCHTGAYPHFIDVCPKTLGIDCDKLDIYLSSNTHFDDQGFLVNKHTKKIIKAIIPVHTLGSSFDIDGIKKISQKYNLHIIEDAAEGLGSSYKTKKVSALTGLGILSFNGNKIITTGGGGAIVSSDKIFMEKVHHLSTTAKKNHRFEFDHDAIGYNLRLPALNAALGHTQLKKIDIFVNKKRDLYNRYKNALDDLKIGTVFNPDTFGNSNCWLNAFILNEDQKHLKNIILDHLNDNGIAARPLWRPLHLLEIYKNYPKSPCPNAENLYERIICLPSSPSLVNSYA